MSTFGRLGTISLLLILMACGRPAPNNNRCIETVSPRQNITCEAVSGVVDSAITSSAQLVYFEELGRKNGRILVRVVTKSEKSLFTPSLNNTATTSSGERIYGRVYHDVKTGEEHYEIVNLFMNFEDRESLVVNFQGVEVNLTPILSDLKRIHENT